MSIRKSVRISDEMAQICEEMTGRCGTNYSRSINQTAERYNIFAEYCLPGFTSKDKKILLQVFSEYEFRGHAELECQAIQWRVNKYVEQNQEGYELLEKIKTWDTQGRLSVIAMVEKELTEAASKE